MTTQAIPIHLAKEKSLRPDAAAQQSSTGILPGSRRIYVKGSRGISVPMRAIDQEDSQLPNGKTEANPPIFVYDTSGDWGDPAKHPTIEKGLPALRLQWISERNNTEVLSEITSDYGQKRAKDPSLDGIRFKSTRPILRGRGAVTQMHYAKAGIITPEMEFAAIRENNNRKAYLESLSKANERSRAFLLKEHSGAPVGFTCPAEITPEFVRDEIAAGRALIPSCINHPEASPWLSAALS